MISSKTFTSPQIIIFVKVAVTELHRLTFQELYHFICMLLIFVKCAKSETSLWKWSLHVSNRCHTHADSPVPPWEEQALTKKGT